MIAACTFFLIIFKGFKLRSLLNKEDFITKSLIMMILYIIISTPFVEWPGSVLRYGLYSFLKSAILFFFTIYYIDSEQRLRSIIWIFILCQSFRVIEPVILHLFTGYWGSFSWMEGSNWLNRLSGSPYDIINPNQLAWIVVTTLAFLYFLGLHGNRIEKFYFFFITPVFIYALILTGSRSGLLSLIFLIIVLALLGKRKKQRMVVFSAILIPIAIFVFGKMPYELSDRYKSIIDSGAASRGTVQGRVQGLKETLSTITDRPIVGHGLGTSGETNANILQWRNRPTHNLYIEIMQELGILGLIFFIIFVKNIIYGLIKSKTIFQSNSKENKILIQLATATQAWIAMHLFYSLSCFGLSSWEWYFFGGISSVMLRLSLSSKNMITK
jgi:O-antigen ligase